MRAVRLVPPPAHHMSNPLETFVGGGSPEPLLMNTEGLRVMCGGTEWERGFHTLAARGHGRHPRAARCAIGFGGASESEHVEFCF
jgi:hypothetical protein